MPQSFFTVEATSKLVYNVIADRSRVRQRKGVVPEIVVLQTQSGVGSLYKVVGRRRGRAVVHPVEVIPVAEIMIDAQRANIASAPAWERRLISVRVAIATDLARRRIYRSCQSYFRKIIGDQALHGWVQEMRGDRDELRAKTAHSIIRDFVRSQDRSCWNSRLRVVIY